MWTTTLSALKKKTICWRFTDGSWSSHLWVRYLVKHEFCFQFDMIWCSFLLIGWKTGARSSSYATTKRWSKSKITRNLYSIWIWKPLHSSYYSFITVRTWITKFTINYNLTAYMYRGLYCAVQAYPKETILGFHSRDKTALLVYKTMAKCCSPFA